MILGPGPANLNPAQAASDRLQGHLDSSSCLIMMRRLRLPTVTMPYVLTDLTYDILGFTYDGVSNIVHTTSHVRCYVRRWTYDVVCGCNIVGVTYEIVS